MTEIRDQVFDVDKNKVIITVVCCDPERLRDKLCCKGGRDILSIEIVEKKTTRTPTQTSTTTPPVTTTTTPTQRKHVSVCCQECYEGRDGGPCHYGYGRPVPPPPCYDYYGYQYPPNRPCYVSRCDCFNEDNPQGCSIM